MIHFFWHRRDLRIEDNAGLYYALSTKNNIQPVFIFDKNILDKLEDPQDRRIAFIYEHIQKLKKAYQKLGSDLWVFYGEPAQVWQELVEKHSPGFVFTNRDYEPYAKSRDEQLLDFFKEKNISFKGYKDHVIFEKNEIIKEDGKPYVVFTPYANKWRSKLSDFYLNPYPVEKHLKNLNHVDEKYEIMKMDKIGFQKKKYDFPTHEVDVRSDYKELRDYPALNATSRVSVHLRFGTVSIRQLAKKASVISHAYLNELIWRDFYQMIIHHFPHSASQSFRKEYDQVEWEKDEVAFNTWCEGKTGYPIVDAGMRELNETGFMHNRVRMVTASFLTKHLLLDWRWGEGYFAAKLIDFELASNVGGWQWAAGSGCDAAPYFRVFNPTLQEEKFDRKREYIKKWIPEIETKLYPQPIIDHKFARERAINRYKKGLEKSKI